jgi:hypothetical protein
MDGVPKKVNIPYSSHISAERNVGATGRSLWFHPKQETLEKNRLAKTTAY